MKDGVIRMKEHLSGSHKNVAPCSKVPDIVRDEIKTYMNKSITSKYLAQKQFKDRVDVSSYYGSVSRGVRGPMDHYTVQTLEDRPPTTQRMAPENVMETQKSVCKDIGRFFYENAIPFNIATSLASYNNIRSVGAYGRGFKPPTMSVEASANVKDTEFIFGLLDSVVEEVGEQLVTPCAAHCINLILEKLGELPQHKNALTKPKKITNFGSYEKIFKERNFEASNNKICHRLLDITEFWQNILYIITTTRPLVQVLRMVDAKKKPAMGFIYNAIDEAKEMIACNLRGEEKSFKEIWNIIDDRWKLQLHRHLHAAGYYLNPQYQYAKNKSINPEIKLGLYHCMDRLIDDAAERSSADMQLVPFRNKEGFFGLQQAKDTIAKRSPVEWWIQFDDGTPELQRFVVKVLSLNVLYLDVNEIRAPTTKASTSTTQTNQKRYKYYSFLILLLIYYTIIHFDIVQKYLEKRKITDIEKGADW
ncbi:hypothetical protein M5K25_022021 [Dendrobium thyrsiflorum]|uniref:DUF659 domain-containing protein n=1 Tax=Dendrobium thyrsiflorum TaxID=117978 RepID=A0ABD0UBC9_DENTH